MAKIGARDPFGILTPIKLNSWMIGITNKGNLRGRLMKSRWLAALMLLVGSQAVAATLPDPFFLPQLSDHLGNNPRHFMIGVGNVHDDVLILTNAAGGVGKITTTVTTQPGFSATVESGGQGTMNASAFGGYYFQFLGAPNTAVHVLISGAGAVSNSISTPNQVSAYFSDPLGSSTLLGQACGSTTSGACGSQSNSFSFNTPFSLISNTVYNIQMNLNIHANSLFVGNGNDFSSGFIDPLISFDPAFGLQPFQLDINVGNTPLSAVPEPSTWAMIILGFAGVGFMGYRRSRKNEGLALAAA
jgi:hypothetical protein